MNGVIINDEVYKVVEGNTVCEECALKGMCERFDDAGIEACFAEVLIGLDIPGLHYFEKVKEEEK